MSVHALNSNGGETFLSMTRRSNLTVRAATTTALHAALLLCAATSTTVAAVEAHTQKRTRGVERGARRVAKQSEPPRFERYPVKEIYKGRVAPVRLDTRRARMFRTRLREDSRGGVNFAGHYAVVFWGCGTGCAQVAVVDVKTGRVYWPPLDYTDIPERPEEGEDQAAFWARHRNFRPDSKLLILTRNHYDGRGGYTAYYYLFDRNRFRLLRQAEETYPETEDEPTDSTQ